MEKLYFYLRHLLRAKDEHSIHSPFIFALYCEVICSKAHYYAFDEIEKLRETLQNNQQKITFEDLGAGANNFNNNNKNKFKTTSISKIAHNSAKSPRLGQLLFRLVNYFQPKNLLDLGTSLGITTAYFAKTNAKIKITTFEGSKEISEIAKQNFQELNINNVTITIGNLNETLSKHLKENFNNNNSLDFVFFDANHQYLPTISYFETCLPYVHENTVFIFDDIYWSQGMANAWETIKKHPKTQQTIDLYWLGIVFFREKQAKEDFILKI